MELRARARATGDRLVRAARIAGALAGIGALLFAAAPGATAWPVRIDTPYEALLVGGLMWGTSGGISWKNATSATDHYDPNPTYTLLWSTYPYFLPTNAPEDLYEHCYDDLDGSYEVSAQGPLGLPCPFPMIVDFVSDALPTAAVLNVSRLIQINLVMRTTNHYGQVCDDSVFGIETELYANDKLIAAGIPENKWVPQYWYNTPAQAFWKNALSWPYSPYDVHPVLPSGYCLWSPRLQSEVSELAKNTVVKLRLRIVAQTSKIEIGLVGDHRSTIVFRVYSRDEAAYRLVEAPYSPAFAGPAAGGFAWLLATPFLASRGRFQKAAPAALFLVAGLAGCLEHPSSSGDAEPTAPFVRGDVSQSFVDDVEGDPANGSLLGLVYNEYRRAVSGARVTVLRPDFADIATTNADGRFRFVVLATGEYTLRVDHPGYKTFLSAVPILVKPTADTYLEIGLEPLVFQSGDAGFHTHDYWNGATTKTLMKDVEWSGDLTKPVAFGVPLGSSDGFYSVLPGTTGLDVKVVWDGEPRRVVLAIQTPADSTPDALFGAFSPNGNVSILGPRPSATPFRIATNWEMTEAGHQRFSGWRFWLIPYEWHHAAQTVQSTVTYKVSVDIHRGGRLPLERGHPDPWGAGNQTHVAVNTTINVAQCPAVCLADPLPLYPYNVRMRNYSVPVSGLVPNGATWLDVVATQSRATPSDPIAWTLLYKPATSPALGCKAVVGDTLRAATRVQGAPGEVTHEWRIVLASSETDPVYASLSQWCLWLYDARRTATTVDQRVGGAMNLHVLGTAHRDAVP